MSELLANRDFWFGFSIVAQGLFSARFFIQWLHSERAGRSVMPIAFWYFSVLGGVTLLIYCLHQREYVLALGQAAGLVAYVRNLILVWRERRTKSHGTPTPIA